MPGDPLGILTPKKSTGTSDPLGILGNQNQPPKQTETIADINAKYGIDPTLTENQKAQINLQKTVEAAKEKHEDDIHSAAVNTAKLYFENRPLELKGFGLSPKSADKFSLGTEGKKDKFSLTQLKNAAPFQQKVAELKNGIKGGKLTVYPSNTGELRVARPRHNWGNFVNGVADVWNTDKKVNEYFSKKGQTKIDAIKAIVPDNEYLPKRTDTESALYQVGGAIPTVAKMAAASATGAVMAAAVPETAGLSTAGLPAVLAWAAVTPDMARQGQMNAEIDAFHKVKNENQNISDEDALKVAENAGVIGYTEGLIQGTAMNFVGQGSLPKGSGQGLWKATGQFLRNQPQSMAEIGVLSATGSAGGDEIKKSLGVPITSGEMWDKAGKQMNSGAIMQLAFNVAHGVMSAPKYVTAQANEVLAKVNPEALQKLQEDAVNSGQLSQEQVDATNKNLQDYKAARAKIPESQTHDEERTAVIAGLIQKKANLEKAKTNVDKSYHKEIDDQIEAANQRIELAKNSPDPIKYAESDDVDGSINFTPKDYQSLSKPEKEGVVVPKDYGEADVIETGEGENKKYTPKATYIEKKGGLEIKKTITIEGESFKDKSKAQDAADNALREHFYENGLSDNLKPEKKSAVTVIRPSENKPTEIVDKVQLPDNVKKEVKTEIPVNETVAGSEPNNEPVIAEESIPATTEPNQIEQPTIETEKVDTPSSTVVGKEGGSALGDVPEFVAKSDKHFEYVPIEEVNAYKEFDRETDKKFNKKELDDLTEDIRINGIKKPIQIKVNSNGKALIVEGNTRLAAAKRLGIKNIPVEIIEGEFGSINKEKAKSLPDVGRGELQRRQQTELGLKDNNGAYSKGFTRVEKSLSPKEVEQNKETGKFPLPEKPVDEMTADELGKHIDEVKDYYKKTKLTKEQEDNLTEEQQNEYYGKNLPKDGVYDPIELQRIRNRVQLIEEAENIEDISSTVKRPLIDYARKKDTENLAVIKAAKRQSDKLGIPTEDFINSINEQLKSEFGKDADAMSKIIFKAIENKETVTEQPVIPEGGEPPMQGDKPLSTTHVQYPPTTLDYSGTGKLETEFGIEQRPETIVKHDIETIKEADTLLEKGWDVKKALSKIENDGHTPSDAEHINLVRYAAELGKRLRAIKDVSSPEYDQTLAELNRVAKASNVAGKEQGRALGIRGRFKTVADGTYEDYMLNELNSNNDAPLTDNQKATALKEFTELEKNKATFEDKTKALEDAVAQDKAANEFENTKKATKKAAKKTHEDFVKDRASIIEAAKEKIRKAKEAANSPDAPQRAGFGGRTKADDLFTIAPEVLKLVRSYAEEGVSKLADIFKEIHPIFKDEIENLSERDIHDIIAGEYNTKKITKNEAAKRMEDLRIEAALINKLERLQDGTQPKDEKAKIKRNQEIEDLQKKIKDFNKENPDRASQLNQIKARNEKETARIKEKIAKGDFAPDEKKIPLTQDPAIKAKYPNLIKDVKKSQDDLLKTKREIELRRLRQAYLNRTPNEKFTERLTKGANVPRTIMASMDFSAPLRQGLVASVSNPKLAARAAKFMFEAAKDEKVYNRWIDDVHNSERWDTASKSGLAVTDPSTLHLKDKEEAFLGGEYAERIPIAGKLIKGSERAYVGFLNKMRWDLFNQYADAFEAKGQTYDNHPELYKGLASFVNSSTGRGGMAFGEAASPIMSSVLFSPRLIASRMNMLGLTDIPNVVLSGANKVAEGVTGGKFKPDWKVNYGFYSSLPKEIRVAAAKDMLRFVAAGITTLAFAKYGFGAEVENDPRSSDFGKIKSGNTRWDIWGGFQPYARVLSQILAGQTKSTNTGKIYDLDGKTLFSKDRTDPLTSFARGKLAPIPSAAWDLIKGKDIVGNDVSVSSELVNHLLPLIGQDVYSAMQDRGISALFTAGIPSVFGVGVQTYKPSDAAIGSLTKEQLKNPVWKFVTDVDLPTPSVSKNAIKVPVDDKHPEGHMTDEEFKKFFKAKTDFIEQKIKEGISNGFTITTETEDSSNPVYTPASKLSKEERKDVMEKISREATIEAKKQFPKLFPKATEKKTIEINEY
mgnify:CR=1 FL=1